MSCICVGLYLEQISFGSLLCVSKVFLFLFLLRYLCSYFWPSQSWKMVFWFSETLFFVSFFNWEEELSKKTPETYTSSIVFFFFFSSPRHCLKNTHTHPQKTVRKKWLKNIPNLSIFYLFSSIFLRTIYFL